MRYEYVESTGRQGSRTELADYEQGNEMFASHLELCVVYIIIRVNEHYNLARIYHHHMYGNNASSCS